jgi:hypothetical protein
MRSMSSTDRPFDVATACSLTAFLSSAFSCTPMEVGGTEDVVVSVGSSLAGRRYRWDEDIVVGVMICSDALCELHRQYLTVVIAAPSPPYLFIQPNVELKLWYSYVKSPGLPRHNPHSKVASYWRKYSETCPQARKRRMRDAENRLLSLWRSEALLSGSTTISVPMIGHFQIDVIGNP